MGSIKALFGISVILAVIYLGFVLVPPYFANYQFEDFIKTEALQSTYTTKSEDAIRDTVLKKAQELDIPLTKDQIKVTRIGTQSNGSISIVAPYTVHVGIPGWPLDLNFASSTSNKSAN